MLPPLEWRQTSVKALPTSTGGCLMKRFVLLFMSALLGLGASTCVLAQAPSTRTDTRTPAKADTPTIENVRQLSITARPWTGDFDGMLERRAIRFYVPYSRSLYFIDRGRERGISADLIRQFEKWVNQKYAKTLGKRPITVFVGVVTRDKMLVDLLEGRVDVAVGSIKVLDE